MARSWQQVTQLPEFQSLSPEEKEKKRRKYFDQVIAPETQTRDEYYQRLKEFDAETAPAPGKPTEPEDRTWMEAIADTGLDVGKGIVGLGESAVGVADIAFGNLPGQALEHIGYDPEATRNFLSSLQSDERQAQDKAVHETEGFTNTLIALVNNPQSAFGTIVESAPMMIGIMAGARAAALKMLKSKGIQPGTEAAAKFLADPKVRAQLATYSAATEGAMAAGSTQETARQHGRSWDQSVLPAIASGVGTATIGKLGSKIPGFDDVEASTAAASLGSQRPAVLQAGKEIAKGTFKEGVLEELPQSTQEQIWQNLALGQPWDQGVPSAAAHGLVAGSGMGFGMSTGGQLIRSKPPGPLERAAQAADPTQEPPQTSPGTEPIIDDETGLATGEQPIEQPDTEIAPGENDIETEPESQGDIDAQVQALLSPDSPKDTVFIANGSPMPSATPEGAVVIEGKSGSLITTNAEKAAKFRTDESDRTVADILGYTQSKNEIAAAVAAGEQTQTLVVRDDNGIPIHQELVSESKLEAAQNKLESLYPGRVEVHNPDDVLSERWDRVQSEMFEEPGAADEPENLDLDIDEDALAEIEAQGQNDVPGFIKAQDPAQKVGPPEDPNRVPEFIKGQDPALQEGKKQKPGKASDDTPEFISRQDTSLEVPLKKKDGSDFETFEQAHQAAKNRGLLGNGRSLVRNEDDSWSIAPPLEPDENGKISLLEMAKRKARTLSRGGDWDRDAFMEAYILGAHGHGVNQDNVPRNKGPVYSDVAGFGLKDRNEFDFDTAGTEEYLKTALADREKAEADSKEKAAQAKREAVLADQNKSEEIKRIEERDAENARQSAKEAEEREAQEKFEAQKIRETDILTKSGKPFKSEKSANQAIKNQDLDNREVVAVRDDDGNDGFAIRVAEKLPTEEPKDGTPFAHLDDPDFKPKERSPEETAKSDRLWAAVDELDPALKAVKEKTGDPKQFKKWSEADRDSKTAELKKLRDEAAEAYESAKDSLDDSLRKPVERMINQADDQLDTVPRLVKKLEEAKKQDAGESTAIAEDDTAIAEPEKIVRKKKTEYKKGQRVKIAVDPKFDGPAYASGLKSDHNGRIGTINKIESKGGDAIMVQFGTGIGKRFLSVNARDLTPAAKGEKDPYHDLEGQELGQQFDREAREANHRRYVEKQKAEIDNPNNPVNQMIARMENHITKAWEHHDQHARENGYPPYGTKRNPFPTATQDMVDNLTKSIEEVRELQAQGMDIDQIGDYYAERDQLTNTGVFLPPRVLDRLTPERVKIREEKEEARRKEREERKAKFDASRVEFTGHKKVDASIATAEMNDAEGGFVYEVKMQINAGTYTGAWLHPDERFDTREQAEMAALRSMQHQAPTGSAAIPIIEPEEALLKWLDEEITKRLPEAEKPAVEAEVFTEETAEQEPPARTAESLDEQMESIMKKLKNIPLQLPSEDGTKLAVNADAAVTMTIQNLNDLTALRRCVGG